MTLDKEVIDQSLWLLWQPITIATRYVADAYYPKQAPCQYKANTAQDKGVTKLISPLPTMSPFRADVAMSPIDCAK